MVLEGSNVLHLLSYIYLINFLKQLCFSDCFIIWLLFYFLSRINKYALFIEEKQYLANSQKGTK